MKQIHPIFLLLGLSWILSCGSEEKLVEVAEKTLTESVYASGKVMAAHQYTLMPEAPGILQSLHVAPGDRIKVGDTIAMLKAENAQLAQEQARQQWQFARDKAAHGSSALQEAEASLNFARQAYVNDSDLYQRQRKLWEQDAGSELQLLQRQTSMENAKAAWLSAKARYKSLKDQLTLEAELARSRWEQKQETKGQFILRSTIDGMVWQVYPKTGSYLGPQSPIADLGSADSFYVELDVDEYDIVRVSTGQKAILHMDAFPDQVFDGRVEAIHPILNAQSRTFRVEVSFDQLPEPMYAQLSVEASLIVQSLDKALVLPRAALINNNRVILENGDTISVETGLKNYQFIQITKGLSKGQTVKVPDQ